MNLDLLYRIVDNQKLCNLCQQVDTHDPSCPGRVLEGLRFRIDVDGPNCMRGCCGYTHASVDGTVLEDVAESAVNAAYDCVDPTYTVTMSYEMKSTGSLMKEATARVQKRRADEEAAEKAEEAEEERVREYEAALAQLEADKPDLSDAGYERRKVEIEERWGRG